MSALRFLHSVVAFPCFIKYFNLSYMYNFPGQKQKIIKSENSHSFRAILFFPSLDNSHVIWFANLCPLP